MGVPRNAIEIIEPQQATTTEAAAFRALAEQRHWRRAIVVTSRYHTARARMALMRRVSDLGVQIIMRPTRYDSWAPDHWWSPRASFRLTLVEAEKMLLYALRLAD
jgi:uncharacterized SAM-binding protein YcdF (DUF218 family)